MLTSKVYFELKHFMPVVQLYGLFQIPVYLSLNVLSFILQCLLGSSFHIWPELVITFKCLLIKYSSLFANFSLFTRGQMHEGKFKFILAAQNEFMKLDQANSYLVQIDLFSSLLWMNNESYFWMQMSNFVHTCCEPY